MYLLKTIEEQLVKQRKMWLDANGYEDSEEKDELIKLCGEQIKHLEGMQKAVVILTNAKQKQQTGSINLGGVIIDLNKLKKMYRSHKEAFEEDLDKQDEILAELQNNYDYDSDSSTDSEQLESRIESALTLADSDQEVKRLKIG